MDLVKEGKIKQIKELNGDITNIRKVGSGEARKKIKRLNNIKILIII